MNLLTPYVDKMVSTFLGKSPQSPEVAHTAAGQLTNHRSGAKSFEQLAVKIGVVNNYHHLTRCDGFLGFADWMFKNRPHAYQSPLAGVLTIDFLSDKHPSYEFVADKGLESLHSCCCPA